MVCHRAATNITHGGMRLKVAEKFRKFAHQSRETRMSDRVWTRTDALNRMLAELYEMTVTSDEKRHQSVMLSRKSAANSRSHTPESSGLSGVYVISVAAKLAEMHPQTLRKYDKEGLVKPQRSEGSRRLYSDSDVERLRVIRRLADELGLNLNGVSLVLDLVRSLTDIISLLETSPEVSDTRVARVAAGELRQILSYVGAE